MTFKSFLRWIAFPCCLVFLTLIMGAETMSQEKQENTIQLPQPSHDGEVSLEQTLLERRSVRQYGPEPLTLQEVSQLLWAAQGITHARGFRTAPSAGALYPLETYVVVGNVKDLQPGIYHYAPHSHSLTLKMDGDKRDQLARAALGQSSVRMAQATMVFSAVYDRTMARYGQRGIQYTHMEAGHAAQNVTLQAVALGLGSVMIGAFQDDAVKKLMHLDGAETPLYLIPMGR